ncbi:MAG TPA: ElyC/SanA/YdcF family protein [Candidatus Saccharimonadales bacterium]|nr:ElyC/SanA/YdcF family protein [Candidatus Saccharimonadales bacterium]
MSVNTTLIFLKKHIVALITLTLILILIFIIVITGCYYAVNPYKKFIVTEENAGNFDVGIVLGAGVAKNGKPYKELQARLDTAANALNKGIVSKLILSGDNRFKYYDEPSAMFNYLTNERGVAANKLQRDFAGRSTYESCERAAKIFKLEKAIIFSAESHLPRAIYLCRHFDIDAYGISSGLEANNSTRRELLARVKAVYNVKLIGGRTALGDPLPLD